MENGFIDEEFSSEEEKQNVERMIAENEEFCYLHKKAMNGTSKDLIYFLQKYRPEVWGDGT